ncbi:MAG: hypothetical protein AB1502_12050, partial [Thermodesulfobacteriota bacterium]
LTLIVILLKRVSQFIIKVTLAVRKERIKNPRGFIIIRGPKVPTPLPGLRPEEVAPSGQSLLITW